MHIHAQGKWNNLSSGCYCNVGLIESLQHKSYHHFYHNFYPKAIVNVSHTVMLSIGQVRGTLTCVCYQLASFAGKLQGMCYEFANVAGKLQGLCYQLSSVAGNLQGLS